MTAARRRLADEGHADPLDIGQEHMLDGMPFLFPL